VSQLQEQIEIVEINRDADFKAAVIRGVNEGLSVDEIDQECRTARRTTDEFRRGGDRYTARRKAVADLEEADNLAAQEILVGEKLSANTEELRQANERLAELRRTQLSILAESTQLSTRRSELRANATNVLQSTAGDGPDWRDPENVRIGEAPAAPAAAPSYSGFRAGSSSVLPSMTFVRNQG
jgi:hypothetical protein